MKSKNCVFQIIPPIGFQPETCVPEVSLIDPNEMLPTKGEDNISYKLWRKHKIAYFQTPTDVDTEEPANKNPVGHRPDEHIDCQAKIFELEALLGRQQSQIDLLQNENQEIRREFINMNTKFETLLNRVYMLTAPSLSAPTCQQLATEPSSVADSSIVNIETNLPRLSFESYTGPIQKSQLMNNLFQKYFPETNGKEAISPSNIPIFDYRETEKSVATLDYLTKYRLIESNECVLDISELKKQKKLTH